jgi:hypothetical protein
MLEGRRALDFALELARAPTLANAMRAQALPPDTLVVIRIAAGCRDTLRAAAELTGAAPPQIVEAATLYLQQILFAPGADARRVLGVLPGASRGEMREHMRWLMRWLHPDRNPDEWESVFAERVLRAWREAGARDSAPPASENAHGTSVPAVPRRRSRRIRHRWVAVPLETERRRRLRRRRIAAMILIGAVGLALSSVPAIGPISEWLAAGRAEADAVAGK